MCCDCKGPRSDLSLLKGVLEEYASQPGSLITILQQAQEIYGYLPLEVQKIISKELDISLEHIYGVVTFYAQFSLSPKGEYDISVCLGTACYVKGSGPVMDKICEILGVKPGETSADGKFSVDATRCLGACGLAPVITINEDVYGKLQPKDVAAVLAKY